MKILLKVALAGRETTISSGTVVEVDDAYGKQMIEADYATAVDVGDTAVDLRTNRKKPAAKPQAKVEPENTGSDLIGDPNPGDTTGNA